MTFTAIAFRIAMVDGETVVEGCPTPRGGIMTLGTLPLEMVGRFFTAVTSLAVCRTGSTVVEFRSRP